MTSEPSREPSEDQPNRLPSSGSAIWYPAWHALDQTLVVGLRQRYFFFQSLPKRIASMASSEQPDLVFFNGLDSATDSQIRFANIVRIEHPDIGEILRVDTFGLDYIIYPTNGEEIVVDGEEEPGTVLSGWDPIKDWTMQVEMEQISNPIDHEDLA